MTPAEAQRQIDRIDSDLKDLYEQIAAKDRERAEYDMILHPEDYE